MLKVEKCPMCGCNELQAIHKHRFALPETQESTDLMNDSAYYRYEKLWILFEKIWQNKNPVEFDATLCNSCGLIFTNPRFSAADIQIKYKTLDELAVTRKRSQKRLPSKTDERAKRIYSLLSKLLKPGRQSLKILDYGGGRGYNLSSFVKSGYSCYIMDYIKQDHPPEIEYLGRDISDLKQDELFDLILFCHTLEHVIEPQQIVKELSSHLTEGGLLYVEVPLGSLDEWKKLDEPLTHINFFSEESVFKCLRNAGLDIVHLSTSRQWVTHSDTWCINIVGSKSDGNTITKFRTTTEQMNPPRPIDHPAYYLNLSIKKFNRLTKSVIR